MSVVTGLVDRSVVRRMMVVKTVVASNRRGGSVRLRFRNLLQHRVQATISLMSRTATPNIIVIARFIGVKRKWKYLWGWMVAESGGRMMPIERKSRLKFRWWPNFGAETGLCDESGGGVLWCRAGRRGEATGCRCCCSNRVRTASITPIVSMAAAAAA